MKQPFGGTEIVYIMMWLVVSYVEVPWIVHLVLGILLYVCYCCCCSVAKLCLTLCNPMDCSMPGSPVLHWILEFAQIHVHWVGDAIQPSHPLLPSSPFAFNLSSIRVFSSELALCIRWPKYQSFIFSISSFNEYLGLISFGIDQFDLLAVQRTLSSLLKHHNLKGSVLWHSVFVMV